MKWTKIQKKIQKHINAVPMIHENINNGYYWDEEIKILEH